jgi:hypothetical protein
LQGFSFEYESKNKEYKKAEEEIQIKQREMNSLANAKLLLSQVYINPNMRDI